ncbi:MAG: hypothetical protein GSR78_05645 [Desulfurococcales archaeon]|nr:hypothetical protein [Desulfurococcales archaeon]
MASQLATEINRLASEAIGYIPDLLAAIVIIVAGYFIGEIAGRAVNTIVDRLLEKPIERTEMGKRYKEAGIDLSDITGAVTKVFVVLLALMIALPILNIGGRPEEILTAIIFYIPKLLGGILLIVYGLLLVGILADFMGSAISAGLTGDKKFIAELIKNMLYIGLIAVVLTIALDLMGLGGQLLYPLILGFIIIGVGLIIGDTIIDELAREHEFSDTAPFAKFIVYVMFILVGLGAIFANYPLVSSIVGTLAWGVAIALALALVPIVLRLAKRALREA